MSAFNVLIAAYNALTAAGKTLAFQKEWHNGTGYLDRMVQDRRIDVPCAFVDDLGRRGIVLEGDRGNVVYFCRFAAGQRIVANGHGQDVVPGYNPDRRVISGWNISGEDFLVERMEQLLRDNEVCYEQAE